MEFVWTLIRMWIGGDFESPSHLKYSEFRSKIESNIFSILNLLIIFSMLFPPSSTLITSSQRKVEESRKRIKINVFLSFHRNELGMSSSLFTTHNNKDQIGFPRSSHIWKKNCCEWEKPEKKAQKSKVLLVCRSKFTEKCSQSDYRASRGKNRTARVKYL